MTFEIGDRVRRKMGFTHEGKTGIVIKKYFDGKRDWIGVRWDHNQRPYSGFESKFEPYDKTEDYEFDA